MKRMAILCLLLTCAPAFATDWYADAVNGNDDWDGTSSNFVSGVTGPKKTLQAALDLAGLGSGDTLWLLPGDYNDGSNVWNGVSRGCVKTSGLTIKSTDGAAVTFVTGEDDPSAAYGYNKDFGMRCLAIDTAATDVVVDGVTLRNGCAPQGAADGGHRNGGGFFNPGNDAWLIASAITNCSAYAGGAMYGGNAYRTKILDCTATYRGGHLYGCGWIYNCLLSGTARTPICSGSKLLNSTVVGCLTTSSYVFFDTDNRAYNSIFLNNGSGGSGNGCNVAVHVANCLFGPGAPTFADGDDPTTSRTGVSLLDSKLVCPFARDARLLSDSPAATLGASAHLALVTLPTGYAHLDLAGEPMPVTAAIAAGCYQTTAEQTASRVVFNARIRVKGYDREFASGEWLFPTKALHPDGDAPVLRLQPVNEKAYALYSNEILMLNGKAHRHHPESDGWTDFIPLPSLSDSTTVCQESTGSALHLYVDPDGDDGWDGLSPTNVPGTLTGPVRSPMVAITNATDCSTVFFAPGTYASGFVTRTDSASNVARFRIDTLGKQLALVGTEGAEKTILVGAFDTSDPTTYGRGPAAIGGIYASGTYVFIKGLTVTGCGSQNCATPTSTPALQRGAAIGSLYSYTLVSDCIVTNNSACMSSSVNSLQVFRSVIAENDAYMDVVRDANCYGCSFYGNVIRFGNGNNNNSSYCDGSGSLNFCSIDFRTNATDTVGRYKAVCSTSQARGCAFVWYRGSESLDNVLYDRDPLFADSPKGDFRLGVLSPAIGKMAWSDLTPFERIALARDLSGRRITLDAGGKIPLGAVNNAPFLPCVTVGATGADVPLAEGSLACGTNVVTTATATVSVATPTTRPFAGFEVGGVLEETASLTLTDFAPGESRAVTAVSGTNWYVNATGGDDSNGGGSPALAKRTIRCATTNALAGDVVNVLPGTYGAAEGEQSCGSGHNVNARVVIPANVSVVSTDGPERTVIVGAASAAPEDECGIGLGPGAVRCVWANDGARLSGFTLTGGRTRYTATDNNIDRMAGGVCGNSGSAPVVDFCILSNNCARNGGAAMYVDLRRCRIVGNRVTAYGPASHSCWMSGCFIDRNVGDDTTLAACRIESTTFGPGNRNTSDTGYAKYVVGRSSSDMFPIRNSVFCRGRVGDGQSWFACATNCVFNADDFSASGSRVFAENCANCVVTNLDAIGVAEDGRLLATSPAVDLGDGAIADASVDLTGTDAFGCQRVYNGRLDAGAAEYDWRPVYAKVLGRQVTVETASPDVTCDGRTLVLPSDGVSGTVTRADSYRTTVTVTGTGMLRLYVADELVCVCTKADGTKVVMLGDLIGGEAFRYDYEPGTDDDGAARVNRLASNKGFVFIVR